MQIQAKLFPYGEHGKIYSIFLFLKSQLFELNLVQAILGDWLSELCENFDKVVEFVSPSSLAIF